MHLALSLATGARVPPQVVAIEYAMARALDDAEDVRAARDDARIARRSHPVAR